MKRLLLVPALLLPLLLDTSAPAADSSPAKPMMPQDLLDRWEQAMARQLTCAMDAELTAREEYPWKPKVQWQRQTETCYRERGGRFHYFGQSFRNLPAADAQPAAGSVQDNDYFWDGKLFYTYHGQAAHPEERSLIVHPLSSQRGIDEFRRATICNKFDGRLSGESTPAPALMRGMQLEGGGGGEQMRPINGVPCYFVKATGDYGIMKLWLDPQHGYNMARFEHHTSGHDLYYGKPLPRPNFTGGAAILEGHTESETTRFEQVDGEWFPMEIKSQGWSRYENGQVSRGNAVIRRWNLQLVPDFEKLNAFALHIPDGTAVSTNGSRGVRMIWRDGKIVPKIDAATTRQIDAAIGSLRATAATQPAR